MFITMLISLYKLLFFQQLYSIVKIQIVFLKYILKINLLQLNYFKFIIIFFLFFDKDTMFWKVYFYY